MWIRNFIKGDCKKTPRIRAVIAIVYGGLLVSNSAFANRVVCPKMDRQCLQKAVNQHPAREITFWKQYLSKPVNERVF